MTMRIKINVFIHTCFFVLPVLMLFFVLGCFSNNSENYKVLIVTGGKKIDRESFLRIFDNLNNITCREVVQPQANDMYSSSEIDSFDVIIFYDMVQEISEDQKEAFLNLLTNGKGMVFLHHSLVSYQEWDEYEKIIGGRFYQSTNKEDSINFVQSTYRHNVKIPVQIVDKNHPVTRGLNDFVIQDEVYGNYKILSRVNPLLTTTLPESEEVIGWTNIYGKSRIVYIQLGHDYHSYEDLNYRRLIQQSIVWSAAGIK